MYPSFFWSQKSAKKTPNTGLALPFGVFLEAKWAVQLTRTARPSRWGGPYGNVSDTDIDDLDDPGRAPLLGRAPCTRPVFLWKNGREMEDKSKRTDKYEKNVTKIVFSDFSPSFLRFNGHSAAAHCIHQGQTPANNRTQTVIACDCQGKPRAAGRTRSAPPPSESGEPTPCGGVGTRALAAAALDTLSL